MCLYVYTYTYTHIYVSSHLLIEKDRCINICAFGIWTLLICLLMPWGLILSYLGLWPTIFSIISAIEDEVPPKRNLSVSPQTDAGPTYSQHGKSERNEEPSTQDWGSMGSPRALERHVKFYCGNATGSDTDLKGMDKGVPSAASGKSCLVRNPRWGPAGCWRSCQNKED